MKNCENFIHPSDVSLSVGDTVSEWLRRWTRNPLGSAREGSNPFGVVFLTSDSKNSATVLCPLDPDHGAAIMFAESSSSSG